MNPEKLKTRLYLSGRAHRGSIRQLLDEWTVAAGLKWRLDADEIVIE